MQMKDINNLLNRLSGIQREIASHIILTMKHKRNHTVELTIDGLSKKFFADRQLVYTVIGKLGISEIVQISKSKPGLYKFKTLNADSFFKVAAVLEGERNE